MSPSVYIVSVSIAAARELINRFFQLRSAIGAFDQRGVLLQTRRQRPEGGAADQRRLPIGGLLLLLLLLLWLLLLLQRRSDGCGATNDRREKILSREQSDVLGREAQIVQSQRRLLAQGGNGGG